jgi:hypothetical protein
MLYITQEKGLDYIEQNTIKICNISQQTMYEIALFLIYKSKMYFKDSRSWTYICL